MQWLQDRGFGKKLTRWMPKKNGDGRTGRKLSGSVAPFCFFPFFLVAAPLEMVQAPKRVPVFFWQGH